MVIVTVGIHAQQCMCNGPWGLCARHRRCQPVVRMDVDEGGNLLLPLKDARRGHATQSAGLEAPEIRGISRAIRDISGAFTMYPGASTMYPEHPRCTPERQRCISEHPRCNPPPPRALPCLWLGFGRRLCSCNTLGLNFWWGKLVGSM